MAEGNAVFDAIIRAVDQAAGPIAAIGAHFKGLGAIVEKVGEHWHGLGHVLESAFSEGEHAAHHATGELHKVGEAAKHAGHEIEHAAHAHGYAVLAGHVALLKTRFGSLNASVGEVSHSITEFLPALGAIGAAGGLVGLFELTEKVADTYSEFHKAAQAAALTDREFGQLAFAAKMTDVSVESLGNGMFKLNRVMGDAMAGRNKNVAALFEHLGIKLRDASGHALDAAQIMPQLAEAFAHTADKTMQARMAVALFGKGGAELLPLLLAGREELEEFSKRAAELKYPFTDADKRGLENYHRSMIELSTAVSGFANEVGAKLAPVLQPVIEMATNWVAANREWIATKITDKVAELAGWVQKLNLGEIIEQTMAWVHAVMTASEHVGGMTTAIGAATLVLGSPLLSAIRAVIEIAGTLAGVLRGLAVLVWANPILAAAAALGIAAYEMWRHWDWVRGQFLALFEWFSQQSGWVKTLIAGIMPLVGVPLLIIDNWSQLQEFFAKLLGGIGAAFNDAWAEIKPVIDGLTKGIDAVTHGWVGRQLGLSEETPAEPAAQGATPGFHRLFGHQAPTPLPQLYGPTGAAAPAPVANVPGEGRVRTEITIRGAPPGTTVNSSASGIADHPDVDVGYAALAGALY